MQLPTPEGEHSEERERTEPGGLLLVQTSLQCVPPRTAFKVVAHSVFPSGYEKTKQGRWNIWLHHMCFSKRFELHARVVQRPEG